MTSNDGDLRPFRVTLFGVPADWEPPAEVAGLSSAEKPLEIDPARLPLMSVSFDEVYARLAELPRMFIELDGSFVWKVDDGETTYQMDGNLCDGGERLHHVTLQGRCTIAMLDTILEALGAPTHKFIVHDAERGCFWTEQSFRRILL